MSYVNSFENNDLTENFSEGVLILHFQYHIHISYQLSIRLLIAVQKLYFVLIFTMFVCFA